MAESMRMSKSSDGPSVRILEHEGHRIRPNAIKQWWALTHTTINHLGYMADLVSAVVLPVVFTLGFYLPLKLVMQFRGIDYAQYVVAIITLQTLGFTMMTIAQNAAAQAQVGFTSRLRTMPVSPLLPMASRLSAGMLRSVVSIAAVISFGYVIGFRLNAGVGQSIAFFSFALAIGLIFAIGADALGTLTKSPESVSQALTLPILIFGMLSTGLVPEGGFPEWIRPFARNQPISHFASALRDMAESGVTSAVFLPALAWLIGLACLVVPLAVWASVRRE